jgi:hypothetical protein
VFLQENGHIISAFQFHKEWSDIDVELEIQAFQETLPDDVDIEIVHSVHTTLLMPTLAPGQYLTGSVINRVFSNNKPVYIRPCRQILKQPMNKEKRQRYNFPDNVFDDNDYDQMPPTINEYIRKWFLSIDFWVMGPARSDCATLLLYCNISVFI